MSASGNLNTYIDQLKISVNFSTGHIKDLAMFVKVVDFLEGYDKNSDDLMQKTEILTQINAIRKNVEDKALAKRLKRLVRSWFEEQQRRQGTNNKTGLVNGDRRLPHRLHEATTTTHITRVHSNDYHTLPSSSTATTYSQSSFLVSIPLSKVHLMNHTSTHHEHAKPSKTLFEKATHKKNNYINSQTQINRNEHLPHAGFEPTARTNTHLQYKPTTDTSLEPVREQGTPSPLGATPPRPPSPFPHKSQEGVSTQDGVVHGWETPVVIQNSTLVISPYSSLFEWENQLSIPPTL